MRASSMAAFLASSPSRPLSRRRLRTSSRVRWGFSSDIERSLRAERSSRQLVNRKSLEIARSPHGALAVNHPQQRQTESSVAKRVRRRNLLRLPLSGRVRHALLDQGQERHRPRRRHSARHGRSPPYLSADWSVRSLSTSGLRHRLASVASAGLVRRGRLSLRTWRQTWRGPLPRPRLDSAPQCQTGIGSCRSNS